MRYDYKNIILLASVIIISFLLLLVFVPMSLSAQITTNEHCKCVVFRLDDIQDFFLTSGQSSVMDLFLKNNQSLSLGIVMNNFGNDNRTVETIRGGYEKGLFELALHGWDHDNYANFSQGEQMVLLNMANQKLSKIYGDRTNIFIPPYNNFSSGTLEALHQLGMKIISGVDNIQPPNERTARVVTGDTSNGTGLKINNLPQNVIPYDFDGKWWKKVPTENIEKQIISSIQKYGYAVITLHPQGYVESSNMTFINKANATQILELQKIINFIISKDYKITNFSGLAGISKPQIYESKTPQPEIQDKNLRAEIVYDGLNFPSKMSFLGPNDILVLEKNEGVVKRIVNGSVIPILDLNVSSKGERGLLGIAVADRGKLNPYVFLYYTESPEDSVAKREDSVGNRLYRYVLVNNSLINPKLLFTVPPGSKWLSGHNGGAMTIGPDNNLYLTVGDQVASDTLVQNIRNGSNPTGNGGILRMTLSGEPIGSGVLGNKYPLNLYYAYGIRNSFGIAFDPVANNLWDSENGIQTGDEINFVQTGFNSGWKKIQGIFNQTNGDAHGKSLSDILENFAGNGKYRTPELTWNFSAGLTGMSFLSSSIYGPKYQNDLFVGDFNNGNLYDFDLTKDRKHIDSVGLSPDRVVNYESNLTSNLFGVGFGGIVDVKEGPDGFLYILSTHKGGGDCLVVTGDCTPYLSSVGGAIYRIILKPTEHI